MVGVIGALLLLRPGSNVQEALEETQRALRRQGLKTELAEFDFSAAPEFCARAAALTNADLMGGGVGYDRRSVLWQGSPQLMMTVGSNAASVVWRQERLPSEYSGEDLWPATRDVLNENAAVLDAACAAALAGPIRFNLDASQGSFLLLPHLASLKNLAQILASRTVRELHDAHRAAAWTNLLAATRLVAAWEPEPAEVSHLVRFALATIAYDAAWQALQADGWPDDQLAALQHEWDTVDFFHSLPETAAYSRAGTVKLWQLERQRPLPPAPPLKALLRSPREVWYAVIEDWRRLRYHQRGIYEDEKDLLLHYRDRELGLRRAGQCSSWAEMRQLPGATNEVLFKLRYPSSVQARLNSRQIALAFRGQGVGLLGRAAEAETRRRLLITAIALERYRGRHGSYPKTLPELVPDLLRNPPVDFMDGKPLRYRLTDDGHFVLYSVGLDCLDNSGAMPPHGRRGAPERVPPGFGLQPETDLVWPRPASGAEIAAQEHHEQKQDELAETAMRKHRAAEEAHEEVARQAAVQKLLALKPKFRTKEPTFNGQSLSHLLRNNGASGTKRPALDELLTLKQIITGEEPDLATFEVPIRYDVVSKIGELHLLVDVDPQAPSDHEWGGRQQSARATNGNCLLIWNTLYDPPGQHALQARLLCHEATDQQEIDVSGPVLPFLSTNLLQLDPLFDLVGTRAFFSAKLAESDGTYTIDLRSPSGAHIRTLTGATSNGVIEVPWDLTDEHGNKYTNDSFECRLAVTLPKSGRSQTLK